MFSYPPVSSAHTVDGSFDGYHVAVAPTSLRMVSSGNSRWSSSHSLTERIRLMSTYIEEENENDLYALFYEIVTEIFGRGNCQGWELDKLRLKKFDDQKYISREQNIVFNFLCSSGNIFKLCYKLLSNSLIKFTIYFSDLPIELQQKLERSYGQSYYGSRLLFNLDSNLPIGLSLNSFEYYMFNFALYGLKLAVDDFSNYHVDLHETSVYKSLCLDYFGYFLPLQNFASMIQPQLTFNVLSSVPNQKQYTRTSKLLNFIKKDVAYNDLSNDKAVSSSWVLTSEATWRSELVSFYFADIWLSCNISSVPSINLTKLIRCFIKHLHIYSNLAKHQPQDNLKSILLARHSIKIYQYLSYYMDCWPQDFSFRLLLENWLCFIQPWRYDNLSNQQYSITENEMNDKWRVFITRNLLCYTKLFYFAIKRFTCIDICSPRYSVMVFRLLKVFTHPYLIKIILDIEHMYISNHQSHKKWNLLMSECFIEAEGPLFKYELMFSEERTQEYKLFCLKLHKSLDHVTTELNRFQEDKKKQE
uniref:Sphingomyelin phosphodiesterase 4 n=1 Tax=Sipha flava TaxID=143950 RepID=A0A2S2QZU4_9HEMI